MKIERGKPHQTVSGRVIIAPKSLTVKNLHMWQLDEAKKEVQHCDFKTGILNCINLKNLSTSDIDTLCMILWGE